MADGVTDFDRTGKTGSGQRFVDAADLCEIIKRHGSFLLARARALTMSEAEAWDLLQDVYERALRAPPRNLSPESTLGWLFVVMRNLHLDRVTAVRHKHHVSLELAPALTAPEEEPDPSWAELTLEDVQDETRQLPLVLRPAYELHAIQGCSYRQVAERLELPLRTVGTRIFRAKRALRRRLCVRLGAAA